MVPILARGRRTQPARHGAERSRDAGTTRRPPGGGRDQPTSASTKIAGSVRPATATLRRPPGRRLSAATASTPQMPPPSVRRGSPFRRSATRSSRWLPVDGAITPFERGHATAPARPAVDPYRQGRPAVERAVAATASLGHHDEAGRLEPGRASAGGRPQPNLRRSDDAVTVASARRTRSSSNGPDSGSAGGLAQRLDRLCSREVCTAVGSSSSLDTGRQRAGTSGGSTGRRRVEPSPVSAAQAAPQVGRTPRSSRRPTAHDPQPRVGDPDRVARAGRPGSRRPPPCCRWRRLDPATAARATRRPERCPGARTRPPVPPGCRTAVKRSQQDVRRVGCRSARLLARVRSRRRADHGSAVGGRSAGHLVTARGRVRRQAVTAATPACPRTSPRRRSTQVGHRHRELPGRSTR